MTLSIMSLELNWEGSWPKWNPFQLAFIIFRFLQDAYDKVHMIWQSKAMILKSFKNQEFQFRSSKKIVPTLHFTYGKDGLDGLESKWVNQSIHWKCMIMRIIRFYCVFFLGSDSIQNTLIQQIICCILYA